MNQHLTIYEKQQNWIFNNPKRVKIVAQKHVVDDMDLIAEWDFEKNSMLGLDPAVLRCGSNKNAWWKCQHGHTWETTVANRSRGTQCPWCSGRYLLPEKSLFALNPELSSEWNYEKNGSLTPDKVAPFSHKKVWWKCKHGHEWEAIISNRSNGNGCPWCAGQGHYVLPEKSLATLNPQLASEWNTERNGDLTPDKVSLYSNQKVWWKCTRGHEWQASVNNRAKGRNCRQCSAELKSSFPEQAITYYLSKCMPVESRSKINGWEVDIYLPDLNIGIEYDGIAYHSKNIQIDRETRKENDLCGHIELIRVKENYNISSVEGNTIWFIVDAQYSNLQSALLELVYLLEMRLGYKLSLDINLERDRISILSSYRAMELKNSFASKHPELLPYWNWNKNQKLKPENFRASSNFSLWWKCPTCNGEWTESIGLFAKYKNCPYCSNRKLLTGFNDLKTKYPEIADEWNYNKNESLLPENILFGSAKSVWWICQNGHEWTASPSQRISVGTKCPKCSRSGHIIKRREQSELQLLVDVCPDLVNEWDYSKNTNIDIETMLSSSTQRVYWKCSRGHSWSASVYNRAIAKTGCPTCKGRIGWDGYYALLLKYKTEHGHIQMKAKYETEDGFRLGYWLNTQRQQKKRGNLLPEREKKLNELGIVWELRKM